MSILKSETPVISLLFPPPVSTFQSENRFINRTIYRQGVSRISIIRTQRFAIPQVGAH